MDYFSVHENVCGPVTKNIQTLHLKKGRNYKKMPPPQAFISSKNELENGL